MAAAVFPFFRATFYRWMQRWPDVCADLANAPRVLAVGDLHVENFGTWRDIEGRLVWGINDFDEAAELPFTIDLVRLAASAHIALRESRLKIETKDACSAILDGYLKSLESGGRPIVVAEEHRWLRPLVMGSLRDPIAFWDKYARLPIIERGVPKSARKALEKLFPESGLHYAVVHRVAGLGSLGRERYLAIADYRGAKIAREAKALAPSACVWSSGLSTSKIYYQDALDKSVRAVDPFVRLRGRWIVRRIAPDCSRVELSSIPKQRDETKLLRAMGFETGNVHLGKAGVASAILKDLGDRPKEWLHTAAEDMVRDITADWQQWQAGFTAKEKAGAAAM